ncbi:diacylglycerol kinase family lipid kinase [Noviherbaspirillum cavernae]|uniref:Diacylglycerol kinase family lipid kinase n=1 Tax=Noviherbaspirillum cavernae TaxID=2320862 RepID=A0A418WWJ2_9BURK|nr:diacylglycerol kinase family protein [Noviherbaspirillum cavernae]RJF97065.1 diacylglycerol kinase family lipid kinase [Noviherbaspirillum cavernae]
MQSSDLIPVIINASSGAGYTEEWVNDLVKQFRLAGLNAKVTLAGSGAEILAAVQDAVSRKPRVIVAGGGDGTINAVGAALEGTDIALGVLPLGTLNHFAKDMHIPLELDDAIRNIADGHLLRIDAGKVNDSLFLNNSSLGIYPDVVRDREKQQRRLGWGKWRAFGWAAMMGLRRYPFLDVRLTTDNKTHHRSTPFIFIGNNEYVMEGFNIGGRNALDGGHLGLYMPRRVGRFGLFMLGIQTLFGRLRQARDFDMLTVEEIEIDSRKKRLRVAIDGEVTVMETPLRYRILPKALTVIAPPLNEAGEARE